MNRPRWYETGLLILSLLLLALNVAGLWLPLRGANLAADPAIRAGDVTLSPLQVLEQIDAAANSGDRELLLRTATTAVSQGMADYWDAAGADHFHLRVPVYDNYLLFFASYVLPDKFERYQWLDAGRALERGVGICSQQVLVETQILQARGVPAHIVGLDGHVVLTAPVDAAGQRWWILDPLNGVVIPFSLQQLEQDSTRIRPYYAEKGISTDLIDAYVAAYGSQGNVTASSAAEYAPASYWVERLSYVLIWVIPLVLALPFGLRMLRRRSSTER